MARQTTPTARRNVGSMTEVRPGVWRLRVVTGATTARGNPRQASQTFRGTERAAKIALAKMVTKPPTVSTHTVGSLLDAYIDHAANAGRSPTTLMKYRHIAKKSIPDDLRRVKLAKLTPKRLDDFYATLQAAPPVGRGNSAATIRRVHALIQVALHQGEKWGWVSQNVAKLASPPPVRTVEPSAPDLHEVVAIISEAESVGPIWADLFTVAALTGARRGELCGLRWEDWDRNEGTLRIERTIYDTAGGGYGVKDTTKNHQGRTIALDVSAVRALSRRWEEAGAPDVGYVFTDRTGTGPIRPDRVSKVFASVAGTAGVNCHLHMLRHWAATQMIAQGVPVTVAAKRLGHADASITLRVYAHALPQQDPEAAAMLGHKLSTAGALPSALARK